MKATLALPVALAVGILLTWRALDRTPATAAAAWRPAETPDAEALRALGETLFFDPALSSTRTTSCSSCHRPEHAFADPRVLSTGQHGDEMRRHTPALVNRPLVAFQFWDGRAKSLAEQARHPLEDPKEMGESIEDASRRIKESPDYRRRFRAVFGTPGIDPERLTRALAAFVAGLEERGSEYERRKAVVDLPPALRRGEELFFGEAGCFRCHSGPNFTDERFHNTGVAWKSDRADSGRAALSGRDEDVRAFKTPTLRQLAYTAPYMHDGGMATLRDVVLHYAAGGAPEDPRLDPAVKRLDLDESEVTALVSFLRSLSAVR